MRVTSKELRLCTVRVGMEGGAQCCSCRERPLEAALALRTNVVNSSSGRKRQLHSVTGNNYPQDFWKGAGWKTIFSLKKKANIYYSGEMIFIRSKRVRNIYTRVSWLEADTDVWASSITVMMSCCFFVVADLETLRRFKYRRTNKTRVDVGSEFPQWSELKNNIIHNILHKS